MSRIKKIIRNPLVLITRMKGKWFTRIVPDKQYLEIMYRAINGEPLNLDEPKTYTEKLNWLKLYDRRDIYTVMVDKYLARGFVKDRIGEDYLLPLIGVWDSEKEIDFDILPDNFVLKCNHNSGTGFYICRNKELIDKKAVLKSLRKGLKENFFYKYREWPYKNIEKKIIAEPFMQNTNGDQLVDYKVFCFSGVPKIIMINSGRFTNGPIRTDFYDINWNYLGIKEGGGFYPCAGDIFKKPLFLEELIRLSALLSEGVPHLRVDFNCWDNKLYFSELTFFHNAGMEPFSPDEWNILLGDYISI